MQYTNIASDSYTVQFCGGSASVPRGMVFPPVDLSSGTLLNCSDGSVVVDDKSTVVQLCSTEDPVDVQVIADYEATAREQLATVYTLYN